MVPTNSIRIVVVALSNERSLIESAKQETEAAKQLHVAIEMAEAIEKKSPIDLRNKLNLGFIIGLERDGLLQRYYWAAINAKISSGLVQDAVEDLDDYLHLFPEDETASMIRKQLQEYAARVSRRTPISAGLQRVTYRAGRRLEFAIADRRPRKFPSA